MLSLARCSTCLVFDIRHPSSCLYFLSYFCGDLSHVIRKVKRQRLIYALLWFACITYLNLFKLLIHVTWWALRLCGLIKWQFRYFGGGCILIPHHLWHSALPSDSLLLWHYFYSPITCIFLRTSAAAPAELSFTQPFGSDLQQLYDQTFTQHLTAPFPRKMYCIGPGCIMFLHCNCVNQFFINIVMELHN